MRYLSLIILTYLLFACGSKGTESTTNAEKRQYTEQKNPVTVMVLQKGPFRKELINNGKLIALRKTDLQFRVGEQLEKLLFKNGDYVKSGQVNAGLIPFTFIQQLGAEIQLKRNRMDMQNLLIGQGYTTLDSANIPQKIYEWLHRDSPKVGTNGSFLVCLCSRINGRAYLFCCCRIYLFIYPYS